MRRLIGSLLFLLIVTSSLYALTRHVPAEYGSIQAGLNASATGDTVLVQPGTYLENIIWPSTNGIKLIAAGDTTNTFIDGNQVDRVIRISSGGTIDTTTAIIGFTIRNGNSPYDYGGGIYCNQSSPTIKDCNISYNYAYTIGGGVYCEDNSSPIITDCLISNNYAYDGGGIFCYNQSNPLIISCIISYNVGEDKSGGINCTYNANPTINDCIIQNNTSAHAGGIYCWSSAPNITNCIIKENQAGNKGGGVWCASSSNPVIINCLFISNWSGNDGGGIYFTNSSTTINNCTFVENETDYGGNISCYDNAHPNINNCNVTDNIGIAVKVWNGCSIDITYSNFFNNGGNFTGISDPDLGDIVDTNTNGDSCDVYQNIFLDPLYIDPGNGDYHLQANSPCIDAGDPDSPLDPDDTISDIGAYFYDQYLIPWITIESPNGGEEWWVLTEHSITWASNRDANVRIELYDGPDLSQVLASDNINTGEFLWTIPENLTPSSEYTIRVFMPSDPSVEDASDGPFQVLAPPSVTLTPFEPPIVIGPNGGGYWYWMVVENPTNTTGSGQAWSQVILPNGYTYGPLFTVNITLGPGETYAPAIPYGQWVPSYAPAGTYEQIMSIGVYPNLVMDTDSFTWEKLLGVNTSAKPVETWSLTDWPAEPSQPGEDIVAADPQHESTLPTAFKVSAAYPNRFNASTTITVSLPEAAPLDVSVYNVMGQKVATLAEGRYSAGLHKLTFNDPGMATGIYFIHTSVPGKLDQVQKVVLVK